MVHALHTQQTGSATDSFPLPVFALLPQGYFSELGDPEHPCAGDLHAQITPKGPKPVPAQEALGSDIPSSSSQAEPVTDRCFCSHKVRKTGN